MLQDEHVASCLATKRQLGYLSVRWRGLSANCQATFGRVQDATPTGAGLKMFEVANMRMRFKIFHARTNCTCQVKVCFSWKVNGKSSQIDSSPSFLLSPQTIMNYPYIETLPKQHFIFAAGESSSNAAPFFEP